MCSNVAVLEVFCGSADPEWLLTPRQTADLVEQLTTDEAERFTPEIEGPSLLGYRGFRLYLLRPEGRVILRIYNRTVSVLRDPLARSWRASPTLERWLLELAAVSEQKPRLEPQVMEVVAQAVSGGASAGRGATGAGPVCPTCTGAQAPVYNPALWNSWQVQPFNNCYNYSANMITHSMAVPGKKSGAGCASPFGLNNVTSGATADGLLPASGFSSPASQGFYAALALWPGTDFHWWRQDTVGCWSHKPGSAAVSNLDNAGIRIADPGTSSRGPYIQFCGYFEVRPGLVQIS